jgi:ADP-heptose:LPS heptosyltransferase
VNQPKSILLISLSNIGDAVMTTPVVNALHELYPNALMDVVADQRSSSIFSLCPYIETIFHKHKKQGWKGLLSLIRELRQRRYDLIVDLRTDGLSYVLRGKQRLTKRGIKPAGKHAVQQHMAVIECLNRGQVQAVTTAWLDENVRHQAEEMLTTLPGSRWLAIGPGANWPGKIWPSQAFAQLCNDLANQFDGFIIVGGPDDIVLGESLLQDINATAINLCGKTSLLQVTAIFERCDAFVGNDSGLGHLASATGIKVLAVFGPGRPERYHPWGENSDFILAPDLVLEDLQPAVVAKRLLNMLAIGT